MKLKNNLKQLNEGFKDKLRAAALATALGTSSVAGAQQNVISAAPMEPEPSAQVQTYQAPEQPQQVAAVNPPSVTESIEDHMEELKKFIEGNEGRKNLVYKDTKGHPTVGVGFNLDRGDAHALCKQMGVNFKQLKAGRVKLTDAQVDAILEYDIKRSIATARKLVSNFDDQPLKMQVVLTDMSFNLGEGTLSDFDKFLTAVEHKDYNRAMKSMRHSDWYNQVGQRSKKLINLVASIDNKHLKEEEIDALPLDE